MNWFADLFEEEVETTKDLQAELRALCNRLVLMPDYYGTMRYQEILEELYKRGVEPKYTLQVKKDL